MKKYIIVTMISSSVVFWAIFLIFAVNSYIEHKQKPQQRYYPKPDLEDILYPVFNLIGGFLVFELLSFLIAILTKSITLNILLHFPALYISLWCAHRMFPHIVTPLVDFLVRHDK